MKHLFTLKQFLNENTTKKVIAYHGTPYGEFDNFSMDNRGTGADVKGYGDYGKGFYFSPDKELAKSYANYVGNKRKLDVIKPVLYTVELTMNNPMDLRKLGFYQKGLLELTTKYDGVFNIPDEEIEKISNIIYEDNYK